MDKCLKPPFAKPPFRLSLAKVATLILFGGKEEILSVYHAQGFENLEESLRRTLIGDRLLTIRFKFITRRKFLFSNFYEGRILAERVFRRSKKIILARTHEKKKKHSPTHEIFILV